MDVDGPNPHTLIPIIFSHGLSANRTMHSGICRNLASHGYIVFAPDHHDLTSSYYETESGEGYYYCNKRVAHDLEYRQSQLDIRVNEVRALIDELTEEQSKESIIRNKLNFPEGLSIDMNKMIVCGHSFGGMTVIEASRLDPQRIKACLTLDPWLFCCQKEISELRYSLEMPF